MTTAVFKALGATNETEALATVNAANQFLDSIRAATGKTDLMECLGEIKSITSLAPLASRILAEAGAKSGDEALGTVLAWKSSHTKLPTVEAELSTVKASAAASDLDKLLEDGRSGTGFEDNKPRLTKAMADELRTRVEGHTKAKAENRTPTDEEWSLSQARAYVKHLPPQAQLAANPTPGAPPAAPANNGAVAFEGKTYEQLSNVERHNLANSNEALFQSMRSDWEKRGCPTAEQAA